MYQFAIGLVSFVITNILHRNRRRTRGFVPPRFGAYHTRRTGDISFATRETITAPDGKAPRHTAPQGWRLFSKKMRRGARKGLTATSGAQSHSRSILREPFTRKVRDVVGDCTAALQRPWIRCSSEHGRHHIFLMRKRNFKFYADIGVTPHLLARKLSAVDTGARPKFIRKDELQLVVELIRHGPLHNVADANNNSITMTGLVDLLVRLGSRIAKAEFIVCEQLAAPVIIGCDFCDRFAEAIYPRKKTIELGDGSTVPIVRRPLKRSPKSLPLPTSQDMSRLRGVLHPK